MKMTKKIMSLAIVFAMVMALAVSASAATVTITGAVENEVYNAYQIFEGTQSGTNFSFSIAKNSPWLAAVQSFKIGDTTIFTLAENTVDTTKYVVNVDETFDATEDAKLFATHLSAHLAANTINPDDTVTATGETVQFDDIDIGYWFVDTSLGSLCALYTHDTNQLIAEKNSQPTVSKVVNDNEAQIGDTLTYTITVVDGVGTDSNITVHDTMEDGLTFVGITSVKVGEDDLEYTLNKDATDCTFEVVFNAANVADNASVVITYTATLNEKAEIAPATNDNSVEITYSNNTIEGNTVSVLAYSLTVEKVDGEDKALTGAEFDLYNVATGGTKINLVEVSAGNYRVATEAEAEAETFESAKIKAGTAVVVGLDSDVTYYLEETKAPDGYNMMTSRQEVKLVNEQNAAANATEKVVNNAGTELPSTGGIGTTIFYALGGLMAVGAGVLLVAKKRMEA